MKLPSEHVEKTRRTSESIWLTLRQRIVSLCITIKPSVVSGQHDTDSLQPCGSAKIRNQSGCEPLLFVESDHLKEKTLQRRLLASPLQLSNGINNFIIYITLNKNTH